MPYTAQHARRHTAPIWAPRANPCTFGRELEALVAAVAQKRKAAGISLLATAWARVGLEVRRADRRHYQACAVCRRHKAVLRAAGEGVGQ